MDISYKVSIYSAVNNLVKNSVKINVTVIDFICSWYNSSVVYDSYKSVSDVPFEKVD